MRYRPLGDVQALQSERAGSVNSNWDLAGGDVFLGHLVGFVAGEDHAGPLAALFKTFRRQDICATGSLRSTRRCRA